MNKVDIILIIILSIAAIRGFFKGLKYEFISIFAFIAGIAITYLTSSITSGWLKEIGISAQIAQYIATAGIFLLVILLIQIVGKLVFDYSRISALGLWDNVTGMIIGTLKYAIALAIVVLIYNKFNSSFNFVDKMYTDGSILYEFLLDTSQNIIDILQIKR